MRVPCLGIQLQHAGSIAAMTGSVEVSNTSITNSSAHGVRATEVLNRSASCISLPPFMKEWVLHWLPFDFAAELLWCVLY